MAGDVSRGNSGFFRSCFEIVLLYSLPLCRYVREISPLIKRWDYDHVKSRNHPEKKSVGAFFESCGSHVLDVLAIFFVFEEECWDFKHLSYSITT